MKVQPGVLVMITAAICLAGCQTAPITTNTASLAEVDFSSNTAQNFQAWPDGSIQGGSTQLDSGVISPEATNWQGTAVSGILSINKNGVQIKNPGNFTASSVEIVFGEPIADEGGTLIVPIASVAIADLENEVTTVIEASTEQVAQWTSALVELSEDQREAVIAELEAQKVIGSEVAGLIRAALEAASPVP